MQLLKFCLHAWQSWPSNLNTPPPDLPPSLRRRVTPMGRHALGAVWALPEIAKARIILSSRHGEFSRTLSLLESAIKKEPLSPADFTLSVHHALIGLLSIAVENRHGHSAVAAGHESFGYGLLEAAACLAENPQTPVIHLHFDEPLPEPFDVFNATQDQPNVLALVLSSHDGQPMKFGCESVEEGTVWSPPLVQEFLGFLSSDAVSGYANGVRQKWFWSRDEHA